MPPNKLLPTAARSYSSVTRQTIDQVKDLMSDILDFSGADERGNWFFRGDTGTGKTSAIIENVARMSGCRFAIAVPTIKAADELFRSLVAQAVDAAVWTRAHDPEIRDEAGFSVAGFFRKHDLRESRVIVGTHKFLLSEAGNASQWLGHRDLLIVDEVPVSFEGADVLSVADFHLAWKLAHEAHHQSTVSLRLLHDWADDLTRTTDGRPQFLEPVLPDMDIKRLRLELDDLCGRVEGSQRLQIHQLANFIEASVEGRAFIQTRDSNGYPSTLFYSTRMVQPAIKKALHFSATVHLEGWQVSKDRHKLRSNTGVEVNYSNLELNLFGWPRTLPSSYQKILMCPRSLQDFREQILNALSATPDKATILLVVPRKLLDHAREYVETSEVAFALGAERCVRLTHFKVDVGSNAYRDCTDVILFGLHHAPKAAHLQKGYQMNDAQVHQEHLDAQTGALSGDYLKVQEGDYLAQIKQLGARGRVRQIGRDKKCGQMRLWVYQDALSPSQIEPLFPCADLRPRSCALRNKKGRRRDQASLPERLATALSSVPEVMTEVTLKTLAQSLSTPSLANKSSRIRGLSDDLRLLGWSFEAGKRGRSGSPARFVRL